ncbi:uncharacterized protein LOC126965255 [Leptidea sinapis]|uniref:uncharacterized protein LOC126965255 n=1 Tax=Leptidea sinapis TaxID=189913 RepID=UPI0021C47B39|nr:uncharacterized protein LOC126965255 [Leptidea sinapis]
MDPQFLLKDEVEFELACRGYTYPGLVSALKIILKKMLEAESSMIVSYEIKSPQASITTPGLELDICSDKISNVMRYVSELKEKPDKQLYKRLVSRLCHIVNRLKLAAPTEEEDRDRRNILLDKAVITLKDLEGKDDILDGEEITPEMKEALHNSIGEDSKKILNLLKEENMMTKPMASTSKELHGVLVEEDQSLKDSLEHKKVCFAQEDFESPTFHGKKRNSKLFNSTSFEETRPVRKLVPISQWGVHFYGDNKFSVNAFIERVEELQEARNATEDDLWRHAIDFFKDDALIWFRANREFISTWNELVILLKRTFQSPYYQEELLTEAKARTQGTENVSLLIRTRFSL